MPDDNKDKQDNTNAGSQNADDVQALKDKIASLEKEKAEWSSKKTTQDDQTLNDKARREREDQEKKNSDSKIIESALTFNLSAQSFLKQNESLLTKGFSEILAVADKEKYDSAIHKANAIKSAWIQEYFSQQSNVDNLTNSQKSALADYQKLTKNGKEERASNIWESLVEPSLELTRRVKKAEELGRSKNGFGGNTDTEQAYKTKLSEMAQKKFFRGKN